MGSIFKDIIDGKLPSEKVYEDDVLIAIKDKYPIAPVHILIIPKKEIRSLQELSEKDLDILKNIISVAQKLAKKFDVEDGYRLLTNIGPLAGQTIFHLHFHLIGGRQLLEMG